MITKKADDRDILSSALICIFMAPGRMPGLQTNRLNLCPEYAFLHGLYIVINMGTCILTELLYHPYDS